MIFSWPTRSLSPSIGLDPSWMTGLQLAQHDGLNWGSDIVYTYGPLGFVAVPQVWNLASLLGGLLYGVLAVGTIVTVSYLLLRNRVSDATAWVITAAIALAAPTAIFLPEILSLGAFALAVAFFQGTVAIRPSLLAAALGALTGLQALVKPPTASIVLLAVVLIVAAPRPGRRKRLVICIVAFLVVFVGGWIASGQPLDNLLTWITSVRDLARYYSEATWLAPPSKNFELVAAAAVVAFLWIFSVFHVVRMRPRMSLLLLIVCVAALWIMAKEGFVKHDIHSAIFFFGMAVLAISLRHVSPSPKANCSFS